MTQNNSLPNMIRSEIDRIESQKSKSISQILFPKLLVRANRVIKELDESETIIGDLYSIMDEDELSKTLEISDSYQRFIKNLCRLCINPRRIVR